MHTSRRPYSLSIRFALLVRLVAVAAIVFSFGGHTVLSAPDEPPTLIVYNGQHTEASVDLMRRFTEETGIKVLSREGSSNELAHQIIEEGNRSPADLIYTEETAPLLMLQQKGLLAPAGPEAMEHVADGFADPKGEWVPLTIRLRTVVYNPSNVSESELPVALLDFVVPQWQNRFGFVPTSGAFRQQVSAIIQLHGIDEARAFLKGLKRFGRTYSGNKAALRAVEAGDIDAAFINNYYWDRLAQESGPENLQSRLYYFPGADVGNLYTFSAMAILKSSKHPEAARQFLSYMTSAEAQQLLTDYSSQYPINPDVTNASLRPLDEIKQPEGSHDLGEYGDGRVTIELLQEVGLL